MEDNSELIHLLEKEQVDLFLKNELYWRQHSRADWQEVEDRDSKYFHNKASNNKWKNSILKIIEKIVWMFIETRPLLQ